MRSIFDNLQNTPFGDLSKGVLNTDVLKGNVLDVAKQMQNSFSPQKENYFYSCGYNQGLRRYYQALAFDKEVYGMECNATTVMYMLQSCGLITAKMSRKDFEHIFTPLNPYYSKDDILNDISPKDESRKIILDGLYLPDARPKDLMSAVLDISYPNVTKGHTSLDILINNKYEPIPITNAILRGVSEIKFSYPIKNTSDMLKEIIEIFKRLPYEESAYKVLKNIHREIIKSEIKVSSFYTRLINNSIKKEYFESGGSVFVGVSLYYPVRSLEHYCLIVREAFPNHYLIDSYNQKHYYYPADDSFYGHTYVLVPPIYEKFDKLRKMNPDLEHDGDTLFFNGRKVHNIAHQIAKGISL